MYVLYMYKVRSRQSLTVFYPDELRHWIPGTLHYQVILSMCWFLSQTTDSQISDLFTTSSHCSGLFCPKLCRDMQWVNSSNIAKITTWMEWLTVCPVVLMSTRCLWMVAGLASPSQLRRTTRSYWRSCYLILRSRSTTPQRQRHVIGRLWCLPAIWVTPS